VDKLTRSDTARIRTDKIVKAVVEKLEKENDTEL